MAVSTVFIDEIAHALNDLPPESLNEVRQFIDFLKFKTQAARQSSPVAVGGMLSGFQFSSDDIARARAEMWQRFGGTAA
ncbi:MAG: DUF2281 domain-containing protein [Chloroflexi bacterium]|nr:DUF2281 domain-containing protein [Chloroflexota bacterium]